MRPFQILCLISSAFIMGCETNEKSAETPGEQVILKKETFDQYITVLGVAQDAGYPHINCTDNCCRPFLEGEESVKLVSCLGLVDKQNNSKYIFDATPDFTEQTNELRINHLDNDKIIDGVFLTHAHIGHYTGLMYLGFEALGADEVPVYAMPKMKVYLESNGPWEQLLTYGNIDLIELQNDSLITLNSTLKITPLLVPHRDEYSETVGYKIQGKKRSALFIPDIDKWDQWDRNIIDEVKAVDYAFLDASFFRDGEIDRDMSKIPHPFTTETTTLFEKEDLATKNKIYFIHFNHSNPTIKDAHPLKDSIRNLGFNFAKQGQKFNLN